MPIDMSMNKNLLRLYPDTCEKVPIKGLYLAYQLHKLGTTESPFVYANFLLGLDGRIALEDTIQGTYICRLGTKILFNGSEPY
jgi:hypothetical protein